MPTTHLELERGQSLVEDHADGPLLVLRIQRGNDLGLVRTELVLLDHLLQVHGQTEKDDASWHQSDRATGAIGDLLIGQPAVAEPLECSGLFHGVEVEPADVLGNRHLFALVGAEVVPHDRGDGLEPSDQAGPEPALAGHDHVDRGRLGGGDARPHQDRLEDAVLFDGAGENDQTL